MKKILLLLVLSIELFASWNLDPNVQIMESKTKIKDGIGFARLFVRTSRYGLNGARFDGWSESNPYNPDYLAHVSATIDDVSVFDAELSPYLPSIPYVQFGFKDFSDSDDITYVLTDNHGEKIQQSFKIDRKDGLKNQKATIEQKRIKPITLNLKAWEAVRVDSAIEAVFSRYSSRKMNKTKIPFLVDSMDNPHTSRDCNSIERDCIVCFGSPPRVDIKTQIALRKIAIFSTTTPKPLLALIQLPDNGFVDVRMNFRLAKPGELFFIGEGKDNQLYRSETLFFTRMANCD